MMVFERNIRSFGAMIRSLKLKPVEEQVIVLTGATSGIGLVTARMAARRGARLVLVARNQAALRKLSNELGAIESMVTAVAADVADAGALKSAAEAAADVFGGFDTWINNAGVSVYGRLEDVADNDSRRVFETNFWGVVNGSLIAAEYLRKKGGALINIGSVLSDRAIPIQGMYSASKHAVKGFTDALRMELEADGAPVSVTLVKPSSIDTPYKTHAKNYLGVRPENPPPVYAPDTVAETILYCAENPVRDVFVGAGGKALSAAGHYAPRATDLVMESTMIGLQHSSLPANSSREGLYQSHDDGLRERGDYAGHVAESSIYTKAALHPLATCAVLALSVGVAAYALRGRNGARPSTTELVIPDRKEEALDQRVSSLSA